MWIYEKKLEFPVKITKPDARLAKIMIEQYGGADGELAASLRYLSQKFTMVTPEAKATLNDIATEEYVCYIYQLFHSYSRIIKKDPGPEGHRSTFNGSPRTRTENRPVMSQML